MRAEKFYAAFVIAAMVNPNPKALQKIFLQVKPDLMEPCVFALLDSKTSFAYKSVFDEIKAHQITQNWAPDIVLSGFFSILFNHKHF